MRELYIVNRFNLIFVMEKSSTSRSKGHNVDIPRRNARLEVDVRTEPAKTAPVAEADQVCPRPPKRRTLQDTEGFSRVLHRKAPESEDHDFMPEVPAR